jgi:hypothetical protein
MRFEIFKAHRREVLAFGWLRHWSTPRFRVPSNRPAATTDMPIAASATAQSRTMIRWSLFMVAPKKITELPVSSPDESPTQRSPACICDGCSDLSEHGLHPSTLSKLLLSKYGTVILVSKWANPLTFKIQDS